MSEIIEIFDNYFIIVQQFIIEIIYINEQTRIIKAIDSIALTQPTIAYYKLVDN